ncbi:MAG TPA: NAD(P)-binding domain-containing protein [Woeseiaceae bacterium]|nr:NAD(P)-binding domain-containing protein [Woeseiaceae bacterium]
MSHVSVIGLGAMGSAIAAAMLHSGLDVTVWNRTAPKAEAFAKRGAHPATTASAAVEASPLTIVCVDDYAATLAVLDTAEVTATLGERTIVQFSTGTPEEARDGERWAKRHGAEWLDGAILGYPREIGGAALIFVSGDAACFERHQLLLAALTNELRYLGPAVGAAAALDLAVLSYYIGAHLGLVHGALVCESEQVSPKALTSVIVDSLPSDVSEIAHLGDALLRNDFSQPGASLAVYSGILDRLLAQAQSAGVNAEIPEFADRLVKRGMAAGLAGEEIVSIIRTLRRKH